MSVDRENVGIFLLLLSLICFGSWPVVLRLAPAESRSSAATTESERFIAATGEVIKSLDRNDARISACYTQLDLSTTFFLVSLIPFTLALILADDSMELLTGFSLPLIGLALLGGFLLAFAQLTTKWATSVYGPSLPSSTAIQSSLAIFLATCSNYLFEPYMTEQGDFLVLGVILFLVAIVLAARAQKVQARGGRTIQSPRGGSTSRGKRQHKRTGDAATVTSATSLGATETGHDDPLAAGDNGQQIEEAVPLVIHRRQTCPEIIVAIAGGLAYGLFSPAFNAAVNDPFGWSGQEYKTMDDILMVARTLVFFSFGFWITTVVGSLLRLSLETPPRARPRQSQQDRQQGHQSQQDHAQPSTIHVICMYLTKNSFSERERWAVMAGVVFAVGIITQFQGGKMLGYATAELVQAFPIVSTFWLTLGMCKVLCSRVGCLLIGMYTCYISAILCYLLSASPELLHPFPDIPDIPNVPDTVPWGGD